jgi:hypothetical protein
LILFNAARMSASLSRFTYDPAGGNRSAIGFAALGRIIVPWCSAGRKPAPQFFGPLGAKPRGSGSTTNVGRLSLKLPSP